MKNYLVYIVAGISVKLNTFTMIKYFIQNLYSNEIFFQTPIFFVDNLFPFTIYNRMTTAVSTVVVRSEVFERLIWEVETFSEKVPTG